MMDLNTSDFPSAKGQKEFKWAPVLFHPVQFADDRLTIGVVVSDGVSANLLQANRLNRLECLFPGRSQDAIFAASVALEAMTDVLSRKGMSAIDSFESPVSGVMLGDFREARASDWRSIAKRWLAATSPLYDAVSETSVGVYQAENDVEIYGASNGAAKSISPKERLPQLVMEYVSDQKPSFARYFTPRVTRPTSRRPSYEAAIDYAGVKVVANFGTLFASRAKSVDNIKRRMWDLSVDMEREDGTMLRRRHEMIIQAPRKNDPQVSDVQFKNVAQALRVLEEEADTKEIRLRQLHTVEEIGQHILQLEAA